MKSKKEVSVRKGKRGVSAVVATVLLILVAVIAVSLIAGFLIPMVKKSLEEGASCFELIDYAEIIDIDYTCYDPVMEETGLTIKRGMDDYEIKGFRVSIISTASGESTPFDLIDGEITDGVEMYTTGESEIEIPQPGGAKTYVFTDVVGEKAELAVMTKAGKVCSPTVYNIAECLE